MMELQVVFSTVRPFSTLCKSGSQCYEFSIPVKLINLLLRLPQGKALSSREARITSLLLQQSPHSMLWVGLASGHMLMLDATSRRLLMATKRHMKSVRCLQLVKTIYAEKPVNYVISGGFGFQQRPGYSAPNKGIQ